MTKIKKDTNIYATQELKDMGSLLVVPEHMQIGESEFIGNMPIRQDIEVLPADEPKQMKLGWTIFEQSGGSIYLANDLSENPISTRDGIKIGDEIIVPTLFGDIQMTVTELNDNEGTADSGYTLGLLEFGIDSRNCWTSSSAINKKCLNKLKVSI